MRSIIIPTDREHDHVIDWQLIDQGTIYTGTHMSGIRSLNHLTVCFIITVLQALNHKCELSTIDDVRNNCFRLGI